MGKSTVAGILAGHGVAVVDADDLARRAVRPGESALAEIQSVFGPTVVEPSGELNRGALAEIIFTDASSRKKLEAILHPRIQQLWQAQLATWRHEGRGYAVVVIPLLFETGAESEFDTVICLACSTATQQQRLRSRGWTPAQIHQRISSQMPIEDKLSRAHRVIWNEGDLGVLAQQCNRIIP